VGFVPSSVDSSGGTIEGSVAQPAEKTLSNEKSFDYNGEGEPPSPMSVGITEAEFTQQLFESGFEWEWSVETAAAIYRPESQTVRSLSSSQEGKAVQEDESRVVGKSKSGDEEVVAGVLPGGLQSLLTIAGTQNAVAALLKEQLGKFAQRLGVFYEQDGLHSGPPRSRQTPILLAYTRS